MPIGFNLRGQGSDEVELDLFEGIGADPLFGGGISAKAVLDSLSQTPKAKKIRVRINSAGGIVTEGLAIYNILRNHKAEVTCQVDGLAGSIASIIAMAGRLEMPATSYLMIHNPFGWIEGRSDELRHQADVLDSMREMMLDIYCAKCGRSRDFIGALMNEEKWMTGTEALAYGLCDSLIQEPKARLAAHFDFSQFKNTPRSIDTAPRGVVTDMKIGNDESDSTEVIAIAEVITTPPAAEEPTEEAAETPAATGVPVMDEQVYKDKIAELEAKVADLVAKLETESSARAKAEADVAEAKAKFPKKNDDDEDEDDEEMASLKSVVAACVTLTGEKDLVRLEGAVMALGPRLQGAANAKAAREVEVSGLIARGKLLPAQKKWALACKPEALAAYLESIGSAKVGPVGEEYTPDDEHETVVAAKASGKPPVVTFDPEKIQLDHAELDFCKVRDPMGLDGFKAKFLEDKRARAKAAFEKQAPRA